MPPGRLFVVATPIGNLGDMPPRAIETLQQADLIAAEDTRHSGVLLKHFAIATKLVSYHEHNEAARTEELIAKLLDGENVALITDAGTPCVSDPGYRLVRAAHEAGIGVAAVPGPSSPVAALSVSGLPSDAFVFHGFFPRKAAQIESVLSELRERGGTHIFLESPKRLRATVDAIGEGLPHAELSLARELTKLHEEVITGNAERLTKALEGREIKGECVLVVHVPLIEKGYTDAEVRARVQEAMEAGGLSLKDAVKAVSKDLNVPKNRVYSAAINADAE